MISNERPSPFGDRPALQPKPWHPPTDVLLSRELQVERKTFTISLKENPRGRFLTITEHTRTDHQMIAVPTTGLEEFAKIFSEMVKAARNTPPPQSGEEPNGNR